MKVHFFKDLKNFKWPPLGMRFYFEKLYLKFESKNLNCNISSLKIGPNIYISIKSFFIFKI